MLLRANEARVLTAGNRRMCTNQGFKSLVPDNGVDSGFLYWTMKRNASRIAALGNGATFKEVSKEVVSRVEIDLPPLEEQRRIAAILDKADAIRRKRQHALALADDFLGSVFLEMFGDPLNNPKRFEQVQLQTLCLHIVDCLHKTPQHSEGMTLYPTLRTSDVQGGYIDLSTTKYVDETGYRERIERLMPVAGDVIYSREGERFGIAALIPEGMTACLGQRMMMFRVDPKKATPEFFWAMLNSKGVYWLFAVSHG